MAPESFQAPEKIADKPPRPRRWIPLSLRMFVAMLAILAAGGALWAGIPAYRQYAAVQEIKRLGGTADFLRVGPDWLRAVVGSKWMEKLTFDEVRVVNLADTQATDSTLKQISRLSSVTWLVLDGTQVTDSGLSQLKQMPHLSWLWIDNTQVTDAGLEVLEGVTSLEQISIDDTQVTKAGVHKMMRAMPTLWTIRGGP